MLARLKGKAAAQAEATPTVPTEASLKASRAEIEAELRTLTQERNTLSLSAVSGDAQAATAIEAIDRDRQRLAGQVETINAALRELASKPRERKLAEVGNLKRMQTMLTYEVTNGRENLAFNIQRNAFREEAGRVRGERLDGIAPLTIARKIIGTHIQREQVFWDSHCSTDAYAAAQAQQKKLDEAREREITRLAAELVESVELPPLPDVIVRYQEGK